MEKKMRKCIERSQLRSKEKQTKWREMALAALLCPLKKEE